MPYKVEVGLPAVNGGFDFALLVGKSNIFPYENGKKVSDERIGVRLTLALQGSRLSTLTVKFDTDPLPKVTDEAIEDSCMACRFLFVQIPDCVVSLYSSSGGGIGMTATGKTAQLISFSSETK